MTSQNPNLENAEKKTVTLIFVRHGETDENVNRINGGRSNKPLNEKGRKQAEQAGIWLKDKHIDVAYVSDLPRTRETADPILKYHPGIKVIYDERIRERHFGVMEGLPGGSQRKEADRLGVNYIEYRPEGGESVIDLRKRVNAFLEDVLPKHHGQTVLLVSHGGPITNMLLHLLKFEDTSQEYDKHHPQNTAITILEIEEIEAIDSPKGREHKLHLLNSTEHLLR